MGRKGQEDSWGGGRLRRAAESVKRVFSRRRKDSTEPTIAAASVQPQRTRTAGTDTPRAVRRESDIPLDALERTYIPPLTSSKAGFRSDGADHERDQEYDGGVAADRWNDEDHYTNKSGDPHIGTHGRTHEANETREQR